MCVCVCLSLCECGVSVYFNSDAVTRKEKLLSEWINVCMHNDLTVHGKPLKFVALSSALFIFFGADADNHTYTYEK